MKKFFYLISILILFIFSSCDDSVTNPEISHNNSFLGYQDNESALCMTLASLSYTAENNTAYLKDSLIIQLSDSSYATNGNWELAWGPCLSPDLGNMMYAVVDSSTTPLSYGIAVRGTNWCFPLNWKEDLGAIEFDPYPYGGTDDSISHGALFGLNYLLGMVDSSTGKSLITYLNGINVPDSLKYKMYITGHSLGGMLATVLSAWFVDVGYSSKFSLKTYTFAAPSAGNQQFVDHYTSIFQAANAESHRVINPNDLVPYFYGDLSSVIIDQIPTTLPYKVDAVILAMDAYFLTYDLIYKQVGLTNTLSTATPTDCSYPSGSLDQYECYVAFNHNTNTYLSLLNAPITNTGNTPCKWK
ncbi:MAG: hypothetical protein IPL53_22620 [Ignavibacteria bacterium]|nr:hypothetical protein [Ignavibacteria bacterium]